MLFLAVAFPVLVLAALGAPGLPGAPLGTTASSRSSDVRRACVDLYDEENRMDGESHVEVCLDRGDCVNVPALKSVRSIDSHGHPIALWEQRDCLGPSRVYSTFGRNSTAGAKIVSVSYVVSTFDMGPKSNNNNNNNNNNGGGAANNTNANNNSRRADVPDLPPAEPAYPGAPASSTASGRLAGLAGLAGTNNETFLGTGERGGTSTTNNNNNNNNQNNNLIG